MTNVHTAANVELFRRAPEEQFASWASLREAAASQRRRCREVETRDRRILFSENGTDVHFGEESLRLSRHSLSQFAALAKVPMSVLERLRPETRSQVLNQCYERTNRFKVGLAEKDRLRGVTGPSYVRVFDDELLEAIDRWIIPAGFVPAVPTMGAPSEDVKPALFRSEESSFVFLFSTVDPKDAFGGLRKGICLWNSEIGCRSLGWASFVFREVCQNLLVWGASGVVENSAKHMGRVREVLTGLHAELKDISNAISPLELSIVEKAVDTPFTESGSREEAVRKLNKEFSVPRDIAEAAIDAVYLPENPGELTTFGVLNGMTSIAKALPYAEDRVALAATAGELLSAR